MKRMLQVFYLFKMLVLLFYLQDFYQHVSTSWLINGLGLVAIVLNACSTWNPLNTRVKFSELVSAFLFLSGYFAVGKIDHSLHALVFSSLFLAFIDGKDNSRDALAYRASVSVFMFTYFLSGLWKLRFIWEGELTGTLSFQLAYNMIIQGASNNLALKLMALPEWLQSLLWITVVMFELSGILIVQNLKLIRVWGILIILFHGMVYAVMNVAFPETQMLAFILMVLFKPDYLLKPR